MEVWKDIPGYEGLYQVSNIGNVRSMNYKGHGGIKNLTPKTNNCGRLWVDLWKNGSGKCFLIHRLVAMAFIPNPNDYPQINHIDEDPKNNRVENLEWCTARYNVRFYNERHPDKKHAPRGSNKNIKPVNQISPDGQVVKTWPNSKEVMRALGWSDWSISECCRGNRRTAYGFTWQYAN
jgi:hypothetical protein